MITTKDNLPYFINHLTQDYTHDYDTVGHAISAAMLATMNAMNNASGFGITGYQASFIMWEMIHNISFRHNKTGLKIVDYDNFLYPQYDVYKHWQNIVAGVIPFGYTISEEE